MRQILKEHWAMVTTTQILLSFGIIVVPIIIEWWKG